MNKRNKFGLIGKNISYSFSKTYFNNKFKSLKLEDHGYENFDIQSIDEFPSILKENKGSIKGLNVTIPYKEDILEYLDDVDNDARLIGAVNTIKILNDGRLKGYNTDVYGFEKSISPFLKNNIKSALILGTGGASKAIAFVLNKLRIEYIFVSRKSSQDGIISYKELNEDIILRHNLIINCTPLGTFPQVDVFPDIPYQFINKNHLLFDLIYNPIETRFLLKGKEKGAVTLNGLKMLEKQADKAWEIWMS